MESLTAVKSLKNLNLAGNKISGSFPTQGIYVPTQGIYVDIPYYFIKTASSSNHV
jgi:hypothetical protein